VGSSRWWRAVHAVSRGTDAARSQLPDRNATAGSVNMGNAPGVGPPLLGRRAAGPAAVAE
jgi:hypothetical protein